MNQDQIKKELLKIEDAPLDFTVILTGKKSKKVNGLYKVEPREILIHNKNFPGEDNLLMYTAIHEYAHHLHACSRGGQLSSRAHTSEFWAIFHGLLDKAEEKGIYQNVFSGSKDLEKLTETIRKKYLAENGNLMKELGRLLLKAHDLCSAIGGRYEDYIDCVLRIPRQAANLAVKMHQYELSPETGADNMRFLAGITNEEKRQAAENALLAGKSPDTVKTALRKKPADEDPQQNRLTILEKEKQRLERTIGSLTKRLEEVERELAESK
jgi:hypothetical protein